MLLMSSLLYGPLSPSNFFLPYTSIPYTASWQQKPYGCSGIFMNYCKLFQIISKHFLQWHHKAFPEKKVPNTMFFLIEITCLQNYFGLKTTICIKYFHLLFLFFKKSYQYLLSENLNNCFGYNFFTGTALVKIIQNNLK